MRKEIISEDDYIMKTKKKILVILLSVAMLFVFPATAFADDDDTYLIGSYTDNGDYRIEYGNLSVDHFVEGLTKQGQNDIGGWIHTVILSYDIRFNDGTSLVIEYEDIHGGETITATASINGETLTAAVETATDDEKVIAIYLEESSEALAVLLNCKTAEAQMTGIVNNQETYTYRMQDENGEYYTYMPITLELNVNNTPSKPITDEPIDDEPIIDEPIEDEPVVDEPATDEPVADEPVVDEPVIDEPATNDPVVDTNVDVDSTDKTSPDTGMGGIAAIAAVSITALGAAVLSKKRK